MRILSASEQVAEHLGEQLRRGTWTGTMPGEARLVAQLGVGRDTVKAALCKLENEGLLEGQGAGRRRRIVSPEGGVAAPARRVGLLSFESAERGADYMIELRHLLEEAGHVPFFSSKTMLDLNQDPKRIARFIRKTAADAWVVTSGSRDLLESLAAQDTPLFALFGRFAELDIAGARPDKSPSFTAVARRLLDLGHRRVSLLCRRQVRYPKPGKPVIALLKELDAAGVTFSPFNLPDWEESQEGFRRILDSLFGLTPPTALILDEPTLFHAAYHDLARRGLRVPKDVSLVCTDNDPGFSWCNPSIAHIRWNYRPIVRRVVQWANSIARDKEDRRQTLTKAEFVEGGTIGPAPR